MLKELNDIFGVRVLLNDVSGILKSVLPLVVVLILLKLLFKPSLDNMWKYGLGACLAILGLYFFLKGVELCFVPLADDIGKTFSHARLPFVKTGLPPVAIIFICAAIGFASTLVEPALKVLTLSAEEASAGTVSAKALTNAVSIGVACGMAIGIAKIFYKIPAGHVIVPLLALIIVLCLIMPRKNEFMIGLAFDFAAATTGPVNIPINSAISLGLATGLGLDPLLVGFGLVGLTCLGATIAVLLVGLT